MSEIGIVRIDNLNIGNKKDCPTGYFFNLTVNKKASLYLDEDLKSGEIRNYRIVRRDGSIYDFRGVIMKKEVKMSKLWFIFPKYTYTFIVKEFLNE